MAHFEEFSAGDKVSLTPDGSWQVSGTTRKALGATGVVRGRCEDWPQRRLYYVVLDDPRLANRHGLDGDPAWMLTCCAINPTGTEPTSTEFKVGHKVYIDYPEASVFHGIQAEIHHVNGEFAYISKWGGAWAMKFEHISRRRPKLLLG